MHRSSLKLELGFRLKRLVLILVCSFLLWNLGSDIRRESSILGFEFRVSGFTVSTWGLGFGDGDENLHFGCWVLSFWLGVQL